MFTDVILRTSTVNHKTGVNKTFIREEEKKEEVLDLSVRKKINKKVLTDIEFRFLLIDDRRFTNHSLRGVSVQRPLPSLCTRATFIPIPLDPSLYKDCIPTVVLLRLNLTRYGD